MANVIDLTGRKFSRLTVVSRDLSNTQTRTKWHCVCECGATRSVTGDNLAGGRSKSCGCLSRSSASARFKTHGLRHSAEYGIWCNMRQRCENPKAINYHLYGGRGITVCEEWLTFETFFSDVGPRPTPQHSLDRIDNNKGYSKSNCRWATWAEQANNRRSNRIVTIGGVTATMTEAIKNHGLKRDNVYQRLSRGWTLEEAFAEKRHRRRYKCLDR